MLVVKLGGGDGMDIEACCDNVAALWHGGQRMILLHGGADESSELGERLGHPPTFVRHPNGMTSRYTDRQTVEIMAMAIAGRRNTLIVEGLQRRGVQAVGLSGVDGAVLSGQRKSTVTAMQGEKRVVLRDDHTGKVTKVNTHLLHLLVAGGYLPVLCPPALSDDHEAINIDGDRAAAVVAGAMDAADLVILSDVPGLLRDVHDPASLVTEISPDFFETAMTFAHGSMRKKLLGAREALDAGVPRVILAAGNRPSPIQRALAGQGTVLIGAPATQAPRKAVLTGGATEAP